MLYLRIIVRGGVFWFLFLEGADRAVHDILVVVGGKEHVQHLDKICLNTIIRRFDLSSHRQRNKQLNNFTDKL